MLGILKIIPLILLALPLCLSIDCFKCRNCSPDPASWRKTKGCGACSIETTYKNSQVSAIHRKCVKRCQPLETVVVGEGTRIECCNSDLCNSTASLAPHTLLLALAALLVNLHLFV
ncbi:hypothetical protein ECG_04825 [Echinococcus granulosus]|uniref:Expressed conserved protein n=1 Tax=Echinococcus granulosus TaxID=6210 RepID=A0A068WGY6_ECHGR|nr:hypothetical protein ECG_04825 [Echinococcus granulosus]CDS16858.1 expressed conserved protein [Echinococcus granulosus]